MPEDYEKISPTAVLVAFMRARYTDMPYAGEIYSLVRQMTQPHFFKKTPSFFPSLARFAPRTMGRIAYLEGRYLSLNEALNTLDDSYTVIEIASGLSARGLERISKPSVFIETDLPDMLATKQKVIQKILTEKNAAPSLNHHFYALNALDPNAWDDLGRRFFNGNKGNIVVIHEGLAQYLAAEEKVKLRDNIAGFFDRYAAKGLWITTDFFPREKIRKTWLLKLIDSRIEKKTGRKYHQFATLEEIRKFMEQGGFQASLRDCSFIFDRLTCVRKVRLNKASIREVLRTYDICTAVYVKNHPDS
ncbi:MAG: class I SAM-dependent methyltransferase [Dehalococcoidia bacterium]